MKRLVTIQDISCFGKCSLTAALPVISAMGVETSVIPTAVLSTHTGEGFTGYTFRDLTADIPQIAEHWKRIGLKFDAIYTGYIGSCEQVETIKRFIDDFRTDNTIVIVDPVMGDNGKMYAGFDEKFVKSMKTLCAQADCILPNSTEAALLLGTDYKERRSEEELRKMISDLFSIGCKIVVMTGASPDPLHNGAILGNAENGEFYSSFCENISGNYHSTGDIFSGVFSGGLALGMDLHKALDLSVRFTHECIKATLPIREEQWYSVRFEPCLGALAQECAAYNDDKQNV